MNCLIQRIHLILFPAQISNQFFFIVNVNNHVTDDLGVEEESVEDICSGEYCTGSS